MPFKSRGFFSGLKFQTIDGKKNISPKISTLKLIETIERSRTPVDTHEDERSILKDRAVHGDEEALSFYRGAIELRPNTLVTLKNRDLIHQILLDIIQIGCELENAELLYKAFHLKTEHRRFPKLADTYEAVECLKAAAEMSGEYAVKAAYYLSFIYGDAAGFGVFHANQKQFGFLLQQLEWVNDYDKFCQEQLALATLGCPISINRLFAIDKERWAEAKNNNPAVLKTQFNIYFNLALQNTLRDGYTQLDYTKWDLDQGFVHSAIDIAYLIGMYGKSQGIENNDVLFKQFKALFTKEAVEKKNCHAAFILAVGVCDGIKGIEPLRYEDIPSYGRVGLYQDLLPRNTQEANRWFQHILDIENTPTAPLAKHAARALYLLSTDKSADTRMKLLKQAHNLGDERSTYELGILELENDHIEEALACFDKTIARADSYQVPFEIGLILLKDDMRNNIKLINYFYSILVNGIEQVGFYYYIEEAVKAVGDDELLLKLTTIMQKDNHVKPERKEAMTDLMNELKGISIAKMEEDLIVKSGSRCLMM